MNIVVSSISVNKSTGFYMMGLSQKSGLSVFATHGASRVSFGKHRVGSLFFGKTAHVRIRRTWQQRAPSRPKFSSSGSDN